MRDGAAPDAMEKVRERRRGKGKERKRVLERICKARVTRIPRSLYTRRCSLLVRAGGSLRSFRNASSRRESAQVFRVRDVRDCAMGSMPRVLYWYRYEGKACNGLSTGWWYDLGLPHCFLEICDNYYKRVFIFFIVFLLIFFSTSLIIYVLLSGSRFHHLEKPIPLCQKVSLAKSNRWSGCRAKSNLIVLRVHFGSLQNRILWSEESSVKKIVRLSWNRVRCNVNRQQKRIGNIGIAIILLKLK